jgi:hypothetical protein
MNWTAPLRPIFRTGQTLLDRLLCVLGAVAFAQLPEFIQQYRQRLGGHLNEARRHLAEFENLATHAKLPLPQFIERTSTNTDTTVAGLGSVMRTALDRVDELAAAETALRTATLWQKPFVFFTHLESSVARATWEIYQPAVPTTTEGLVYAAAGMVVFLGLYHGLVRAPISTVLGRPRTASATATT